MHDSLLVYSHLNNQNMAQSLAHTLFQRKASKDLDAETVVAGEALAHAHKVLQDLKIKRQLVLFSPTTSVVPLEGSLLASLIPSPFLFSFFFFSEQFRMYKFISLFFFLSTLDCLSFCDIWILVI